MKEITEKDFVEALNRVAATIDGQIVIACLKEYINYDGDIVVGADTTASYANAILRRPYLYLRSRINPDHLKQIEFNYRRKAQPNDRPVRATKPSDRPARISGK